MFMLWTFAIASGINIMATSAFADSSLTSTEIPHHLQVFCLFCFSHCKSRLSISFETNSGPRHIE
jgi:hypothetical protein